MVKEINPVCKAITDLEIQGNEIGNLWYKKIKTEYKKTTNKNTQIIQSKKPNLLAIVILADIIDWYKLTEEQNPSEHTIGWKKKFKDDKLQKSYQNYANLFGVPKSTIKQAFDQLERMGLITREFRSIKVGDENFIVNNVMYIEPVPSEIKKITEEKYADLEYIKPDDYIKRFLSVPNKKIGSNYKLWLLLNKCTNYDIVGKYASELNYQIFLKTLYWKGVRYYVKRMNDFKCQQCTSKEKLAVHHTTYEHRGHDHLFWETTLVCLCNNCHKKTHNIIQ